MNIWYGIGNITKDPEVKYKPGNEPLAVLKMTIAINEYSNDQETANFIQVTVFGKQAENCEKYLKKGSKVAVSGYIKTGTYEKDGEKKYTSDVIARRVEFL